MSGEGAVPVAAPLAPERYGVERRGAKRFAVVDLTGRTAVTRLVNEYATRRDAENLAAALNTARPVALPQPVRS